MEPADREYYAVFNIVSSDSCEFLAVLAFNCEYFEHYDGCICRSNLEFFRFKIKGFEIALGTVAKLKVEEREFPVEKYGA